MRSLLGRLLIAMAACVIPHVVQGQSAVSRLIEQARGEIDALNVDSAFTILQLALRRTPTATERIRAFTLLGITQLSRDDRVGARSALEQALRLDPGLRVDSLTDLHTDLRTVFGEVRTALGIVDASRDAATGAPRGADGAVPRLTASATAPGDTVVPANEGLLPIRTATSYRARVVLTVTPAAEPGRVLWVDTSAAGVAEPKGWNLRSPDGLIVPTGRYALRAHAVDSLGQVSPTVESILVIDRVAVDTVALPSLQGPQLPETIVVGRGSPRGLASGLLVAVSAVALPAMLGNADLQTGASYPTSYVVAAAVSTASVIGFLRGSQTRPLPENVRLNAQGRERAAAERVRAVEENKRRLDAAPVRVRVESARR